MIKESITSWSWHAGNLPAITMEQAIAEFNILEGVLYRTDNNADLSIGYLAFIELHQLKLVRDNIYASEFDYEKRLRLYLNECGIPKLDKHRTEGYAFYGLPADALDTDRFELLEEGDAANKFNIKIEKYEPKYRRFILSFLNEETQREEYLQMDRKKTETPT